ncbi:MAG TPA: hypothetical protein VLG09_01550 [Candidatus Saccharimonadales bacterium]|nr:hypothetical protein [Candidatus Saccharimonadales bacterium]
MWFFILTGVVAFLMTFIFTLQLDLWPDPIKNQARAIIYGTLAFPLFFLVVDIWRKNPHHWSWSKDD